MARIIGYVKSMQQGTFYVRDKEGHVRELKAGDPIREGEIVYGAISNSHEAKIVIDMVGENADDIVLAGNSALYFDVTLLAGVLGTEDTVIDSTALKNAWALQSTQNPVNVAAIEGETETAAGQQTITDGTRIGDSFDNRTAGIRDVTTALLNPNSVQVAEVQENFFRPVLVDTRDLLDNAFRVASVLAPDTKTVAEDTPATGNVLANDSDVDNTLSVATFTVNGVTGTFNAGTTATIAGVGTVTIAANGDYTFTPVANWNGTVPTVTYTTNTGSSSTLAINVTPVNDLPTITITDMNGTNSGHATVYENAMSIGNNPSSNAEKFIGQFTISDVEGLASITLGGQTIALSNIGNGTHYNVDHGYITLDWFTPSIGEVGYTYTLTSPTAGDNVILPITIGVTDTNGVTTNGILNVQVIDDAPTIQNFSATFVPSDINTNLMVTLDVSGSMSQQVGGGITISKLAMAKDALANLVDKYDALGEVKVMLVTFDSYGYQKSAYWMSANEIKSVIADLSAGSNTNYDTALATAMSAFAVSTGKLTGTNVQNISYFLSDGVPNEGNGSSSSLTGTLNSTASDAGIQTTEETTWKNFLVDNKIISYAIGQDTNNKMDPIAYDGVKDQNMDATEISSLSQLNQTLATTVPLQPITGTLSGNINSSFGADGGYVYSFKTDGVTYTYDIASHTITPNGTAPSGHSYVVNIDANGNHVLVITTSHQSEVTVNFDTGTASYRAPGYVTAGYDETFDYTLRDNDGDSVSTAQSAVIHVDASAAVANTTNLFGSSGNNTINGTSANETLIGGSGNDTLNGGDGNDVLIGGAGTDILNGGAGNDTLVFDSLDTLRGDSGIDTVVLLNGTNIDFSTLANTRIQTIEMIDLKVDGNHNLTNISLQDVIDMTDSNHTLKILGDSSDNVDFANGVGNDVWTKTANASTETIDGVSHTFDHYTNSKDTSVLVKVETTITDTI